MFGIFLIGLNQSLELAITILFFVLAFKWLKDQLGDPKLAVILSGLITFLTVYSFPELVWLFAFFLIALYFGKNIMGFFNAK